METNNALADTIKRSWPLPKKEAEELAKVVLRVGQELVIPLAPFGRQPVNIDTQGAFSVKFDIPSWGYNNDIPTRNKMMAAVCDMISKSPAWQKGDSISLRFRSARAYSSLRNPRLLSTEDIEFLGLTNKPDEPAIEKCCSSLADAILGGRNKDVLEIMNLVSETNNTSKPILLAAMNNGVRTDASQTQSRPDFQTLWNAFLKQGLNSTKHIAEIIGGKVEVNAKIPVKLGGWSNFCSVRISYVLNQGGDKVPFIKGKTVSG